MVSHLLNIVLYLFAVIASLFFLFTLIKTWNRHRANKIIDALGIGLSASLITVVILKLLEYPDLTQRDIRFISIAIMVILIVLSGEMWEFNFNTFKKKNIIKKDTNT